MLSQSIIHEVWHIPLLCQASDREAELLWEFWCNEFITRIREYTIEEKTEKVKIQKEELTTQHLVTNSVWVNELELVGMSES